MSKPPRIDALDGLRALSVMAVIIGHLAMHSSIRLPYSGNWYDQPFHQLSQVGVYTFFAISGFVITRGLIVEHERAGCISIAEFFRRRVFRILPPLALYLLTVKTLAVSGLIDQANTGLVLGALFGCNLSPFGVSCDGWMVGHLWSLSYEEQFYLAFPFFFAFALKGGFLGRLVAVLLGGLLLLGVKAGTGEIVFPIRGFLYISAGVVAAFWEAEIRTGLGRFQIRWISAALSWRPLVEIGRRSYGIYLWQQVATYPYEGAGHGFYALALAAVFAGCWLSFRYFELPLMQYGSAVRLRTVRPASTL